MMTIRRIKIIIDQRRGILVESNGSPDTQKFRMVRGDTIHIDIDYVDVNPVTQVLSPTGFGDGTVFRLVGKKRPEYDGPEVMLAEPNQFNRPQHRSDVDPAQGKLCVRFKLNRKALADALGKVLEDLPVVFDIEAITIDGDVSTLVQLKDVILNDAAKNPSQIDASPVEYITLDEFRAMLRQVTHPDGGTYRIEDGQIKLIDTVHEDFVGIGMNDYAVGALEDS